MRKAAGRKVVYKHNDMNGTKLALIFLGIGFIIGAFATCIGPRIMGI